MKQDNRLLLMFVAVLVGCVYCWPPAGDNSQQAARVAELPPLFSFDLYRKLFKKVYSSHLEEAARHFYLLANAFKVYVAGVAYKYWRQSYCLALNEMSDWSPKELDMMVNKVLAGESTSSAAAAQAEATDSTTAQAAATGAEPIGSQMDPDELAGSLEQKIKERLADREFQLRLRGDRRSERRKRAADEAERDRAADRKRRRPRVLDIHDLVHYPRNGRAHKAPKQESLPASNNPLHDWRQMEPITRGLIDQQQSVKYWSIDKTTANQVSTMVRSNNLFFGLFSFPFFRATPSLPDEMFVDLRTTNCLSEVRSQGQCGSCYAFAAITLMEYWYCQLNNGMLASFSEQYMVDCGKGRVEGLNGCSGGTAVGVAQFLMNFGLELRLYMPYLASESICRYSNDTDLQRTGFIRPDLDTIFEVGISSWPEQLKVNPIYVNFAFSSELIQYGKGVYMGEHCKRHEHFMVVIGHGREDGEEFWLIRNSHGPNWGEAGHMKVSKRAKHCFGHEIGYVFGTQDGNTFPGARTNSLNTFVQLYKEALRAEEARRAELQRQMQMAPTAAHLAAETAAR
jgi:hypothetical protein